MEPQSRVAHDSGRLVVEPMHRRKDGTLLPVEIAATEVEDATQKGRWFIANVNAVTERRRHQQSTR